MNRCKTCKHWQAVKPGSYMQLEGAGGCSKAPQIWEVTEGDDFTGVRKLKKEHAAILAVVEDGSAYHAQLVTMPDFGCVQHESAT